MNRIASMFVKKPPAVGLGALVIGILSLGLGWPADAPAQGQVFQVTVNKSRVIPLSRATGTISVGNPGVADIRLLDPSHLYILGRTLGTTNVTLRNKGTGVLDKIDVEVTHDLDGLKAKLHELLPGENPKVFSSQGSIVLAGEVSSLVKMDAVLSVAKTFLYQAPPPPQGPQGVEFSIAPGADPYDAAGLNATAPAGGSSPAAQGQNTGIINLMQIGGPQQVMLEVKVAEINRTLAKNLKVDFAALDPSGRSSGGAIRGLALIDTLTDAVEIAPSVINPAGLFARFISSDFRFNAVINAAREHGLAKVLAEPTLTTISGQEASFLSGGEFPIPVGQGLDTVTIEFKEFGVGIKFLPVVLDSGRISLKLNIDVSELTNTNTVTASITNTDNAFVIPALTKRRANSSVELSDGQTIGIAGLISDNLRDSVNKFPGLGEIPILGQLFTSQEFQKNQTELVIFVTPRLARPMPNSTPRLPTDQFVEPNDVEFYLMGRTEGRAAPRPRPTSMTSSKAGAGGMSGQFGQQR
ncbi:MAG: type II and III secretion system protein family protein [Chromatiales bacterium]